MKWCSMRKTQKVQRKAKRNVKSSREKEVALFDL